LVSEPEARRELAALCANQSFIAEAPVVVVACGCNLHLNSATEEPNLWVLVDGAIALDHLTLAARAEGLGTCWIGVIGSREVKEFIGLPEDMDVVSVTPLGYPASPDAFRDPGEHVPMEEFAQWGRWA
jgi:nitroreductase